MKAAVLTSKYHIVIQDVAAPELQADNEVLIRVRTVGICGSEVHAFHGTHPFRKPPAILGHEMAGDVVAVGSAVIRVSVGDRVTVDPHWPCGKCHYCRIGSINLCLTKRVLGTQEWPGAFGEYILAPEEAVFRLPDHLSYAQGSLIEPLTIAVHVLRRAGLQAGESVAVLGSGSIGGMLIGASRALGAYPIIAADIRRHCLDAARERMGATHDILLPQQDLVAEVLRITEGVGVDVACIAADDPLLVSQAVQMVKGHGRVALVALLCTDPIRLAGYEIIRKEVQLLGNTMSVPEDVQQALELAATGRVDVDGILTHILPHRDAQRAVEMAASKADGVVKVMLTYD
ncbi:MAG: zinc-dependent alcohol dehydrogenase [Anaerolineae bacterium]